MSIIMAATVSMNTIMRRNAAADMSTIMRRNVAADMSTIMGKNVVVVTIMDIRMIKGVAAVIIMNAAVDMIMAAVM